MYCDYTLKLDEHLQTYTKHSATVFTLLTFHFAVFPALDLLGAQCQSAQPARTVPWSLKPCSHRFLFKLVEGNLIAYIILEIHKLNVSI